LPLVSYWAYWSSWSWWRFSSPAAGYSAAVLEKEKRFCQCRKKPLALFIHVTQWGGAGSSAISGLCHAVRVFKASGLLQTTFPTTATKNVAAEIKRGEDLPQPAVRERRYSPMRNC